MIIIWMLTSTWVPSLKTRENMTKLWKISDTETLVTFPYDISFEIFCYLINFLVYPFSGIGTQLKYNVRAWTTVKNTDEWINDLYHNKKTMIYVDKNDKEHDNVNLVFENDENCQIGFSMDANLFKLNDTIMKYENPKYALSEIKKYNSTIIK